MRKIINPLAFASLLALGAATAHAADSAENWTKNCASCHGKDGGGHTKAGRMAGVKDMTDPAYQKSFTDDDAVKQITSGLKDKDGKERMKAFGETFSGPEIRDLVAYVRSLKK